MPNNNLVEYILKILKKYKINNLFIDNEIIYNFWDDDLCNPFVDSLMAEQRYWDISTRPFFYKDDICYSKILYIQYLLVKYMFYPIGKTLVFIIHFIKLKYLFVSHKILHSTIFLNLFGPLKIVHFEMVLRIWFFFASIVIICFWIFCIYILYLMFKYVKQKSKKVLIDLFYLCLDWNLLIYHYIFIICFLIFDCFFLLLVLPFPNYPKLRKFYRFIFKIGFLILIIVPVYLYIYFEIFKGL